MYRKPKFLEILHGIRQQMAAEGEYDVNRFLQLVDQQPTVTEPEPDRAAAAPVLAARRPRARKTQKKL